MPFLTPYVQTDLFINTCKSDNSSNINEVIKAVLSSSFFFLRKDFTHTKSTKSTKSTKRHKDPSGKSTKMQISK